MIQAKDLRINNWLKINQTWLPTYVRVTQVYMDGFTVDYHYPGLWCESIVLTPELLLKAGFEKENESWVKDGVELHFDGEVYYHINSAFNINFIHLHILQNWWHTNTGEELIIEL